MIDLYTWSTPNGRKASIMLEECAMPYTVHPINIGKNVDQFTPAFVKINPNSKIPAIVDSDGPGGKPITIFESGAILIYLAEKSGKFLSREPREPLLVPLRFVLRGAQRGPCEHKDKRRDTGDHPRGGGAPKANPNHLRAPSQRQAAFLEVYEPTRER